MGTWGCGVLKIANTKSWAIVACLAGLACAAGGAEQEGGHKEVRMGGMRCSRILFLGNSITRHPPKADIGWSDDWGMAASAEGKDYVHLLVDRIAAAAGAKPEAMVQNIAGFERDYAAFDTAPLLKKFAEFKPDVVVLAIGENVPKLDTEEKKARFKAVVAGLLAGIAKDARPALFVRSSFWSEPVRDGILAEVCKDAGGVFVDISAQGRIEANFARSERKFQNDGVANHPGDRGMQAIADAIWQAMAAKAGIP